MNKAQQAACKYSEQVATSSRIHADMYIGGRVFTRLTDVVFAAFLAGHEHREVDRPRIVCLCGSTRFKEQFEAAERNEGLDGNIVLTVACFGHAGDLTVEQCTDGHPTKIALDELHKRKIDLADEILVINVGGYVGSSTRSEIDYAEAHGKPVRYLEAL